MKYRPINGWTKERMIQRMREKMPKDGSRAGVQDNFLIRCRYRATNGCCAVGAFIPDDAYLPSMEGLPIESPGLECVRDYLPLPLSGMVRLQMTHDHCPKNAVEECVEWVEDNVADQQ